jgi:hypothetical protein
MATAEIPTPEEVTSDPGFEFCSDLQKAAVTATPGKPLLLIGGFNSGKTTAAILHMLSMCEKFPGYKVAVLRKTFNDLKLTTRPSFDQWIKPEFVKHSSEKEVILMNGSSFVFHHLDRPDSATILRGLEINAAILDQAEQMQEPTFTILLGRLGRWKGSTVPPWVIKKADGAWPYLDASQQPVPPVSIILTANPSDDGDPELHWLWQRFSSESKRYNEKYSDQGYRQIILPTATNKFAGQQNIEFLLQQDEDYVDRYYHGKWVRSKGHLFRLDEQSIIEYDPALMSQIQNTMNLGRVLDHGDSAPTCCLWYAADGESNIFFWQEYYQPGISEQGEWGIEEHRTAIAQMSGGHTIRTNLADPSIFSRTRGISGFSKREKRWSVADEYTDKKIITTMVGGQDTAIHWRPADNNEELSRMRMRQYLKPDPNHRHPITEELGAPHLYFIKANDEWPQGCSHAMKEIRSAKRLSIPGMENDGKPVYGDERDPAIPDHALDCVRYVVNSRPLPASSISPEEKSLPKAYANPDGRVRVTLPPVSRTYSRPQRYIDRGGWKSRGGGY